MWSISRWRARHLFAAWIAYWVVLAAVRLGRPALLALRLVNTPEGHGNASISGGFDGGQLKVTMIQNGVTQWVGATSFGTLALWLTVPPLLLWLVWLMRRPAPVPTRPPELPGPGLPTGAARESTRDSIRDRVR
ncbi:MAG: hypothetical protein JO180_09765 [Gemmatirosa sp.]|nr:hypothetical protein [Gemmatirosa sp.]